MVEALIFPSLHSRFGHAIFSLRDCYLDSNHIAEELRRIASPCLIDQLLLELKWRVLKFELSKLEDSLADA